MCKWIRIRVWARREAVGGTTKYYIYYYYIVNVVLLWGKMRLAWPVGAQAHISWLSLLTF